MALASGAATSLAFPTTGLAPLAFVSLVPLLLLLAGGNGGWRAFRLGYLYGLGFFAALLRWIPNLPPENVTIPFLMYPATLLAAGYLALFPAVWAVGASKLLRRGSLAVALGAPALWALLEALRAAGFIGFPWGSLGYSQWASLSLVQFARVGGLWSVSLWVALVNVAFFLVLRERGTRRMIWAAVVVIAMVAPWLDGRAVLARSAAADRPTQPVLLIQPNTGNDKWEPARRVEVITGLVQATIDAARGAPPDALIIWPETATPTLLKLDPPNLELVQSVPAALRRPLLTGYPDRKLFTRGHGTDKDIEARYYNAAGLFLADGEMVESYAKNRLVPFSEYLPVPGLNRINFGQGNFTPGDSLHVFRRFPHPFGVMICFESIFPSLARGLVRRGALFLVNVTNDQWFGDSPAPWQHLSMAVFRAIENNVGIARAANTGVTCVIDPTGAIHDATRLFRPAAVNSRVVLGGARTIYTRYGDWILWVAGAALVAAFLRPRKAGRET